MLIDTHCHLAFQAFDDSWPEVVKRAREKGIQMVCVGAARSTSEKSIAIAEQSDGVFASIGIHPTHIDEVFSAPGGPALGGDYEWFSQAAENPKVVAIGETGIDHFHIDDTPRHPERSPSGILGAGSAESRDIASKSLDPSTPSAESSDSAQDDEKRRAVVLKQQEDLLRQHLTIAQEKKLPVILHSRDLPTPRLRQAGGPHEQNETSYDHLLRIVKEFGYFNCVKHCFSGNWETAKKFLDLGLMISFTGIATFKNASESLKEAVRNAPLDRFMIETDSPYLAPEPYRGKQNEPAFVEYIARGIAQIRGVDYDTIVQATTENAKRFFKI